MKSWKVLLGVGGACAACCALPIAGWLAGLGALVAGGLAWSMDTMVVAGAALLVLAFVVAGRWSRRRAARQGDCGCASASTGSSCSIRPGAGCA